MCHSLCATRQELEQFKREFLGAKTRARKVKMLLSDPVVRVVIDEIARRICESVACDKQEKSADAALHNIKVGDDFYKNGNYDAALAAFNEVIAASN